MKIGQTSPTRRKLKAYHWACRPVRTDMRGDFLGIKRMKRRAAAKAAGVHPQYVAEPMDTVGANPHTVSAAVFTNSLLITKDVENIKTILTSQNVNCGFSASKENVGRCPQLVRSHFVKTMKATRLLFTHWCRCTIKNAGIQI